MLRVWLLVLLIFVVVVHSAKKVPEKFLGSWAVKESENFEEYLIARGEYHQFRSGRRAEPIQSFWMKPLFGLFTLICLNVRYLIVSRL